MLSQENQRHNQQVGITNTGHQQHRLQEAQQLCQARPGLGQLDFESISQLSEQEYRIWKHQQLDAHLDSLIRTSCNGDFARPHSGSDLQHYVKIERSRSHPGQQTGNTFNQGVPDLHSHHASIDHGQHGRASERRNERPMSSRSMQELDSKAAVQFEVPWQLQRPFTPPQQCNPGYSPMTPATTPYSIAPSNFFEQPLANQSYSDLDSNATIKPNGKQSPVRVRPQSGLIVSTSPFTEQDPNATVKPSQRPRPLSSPFTRTNLGDLEPSSTALPSPKTSPVKDSAKYDVARLPDVSVMGEIPKFPCLPEGEDAMLGFLDHDRDPVNGTSFQDSDAARLIVRQDSPLGGTASLHSVRSSIDFGALDSSSKVLQSPGTMGFGNLNLDATVEETGVSAEEVQAYITEDTSNPKWPYSCVYPGCDKQFGRKENIRSHVQTHLNDRRFKCVHCTKRFVRQHDLKRHAKIHSGTKPYLCACGRDFARHDALTRHRQRGICRGGFEGVVRKQVKRGRPRKPRPNEDERVDKAARTRKKAQEKAEVSSVSATSDSSFPASPATTHGDDFETEQRADADGMELLCAMNAETNTFPQESFSYTPPMSPYSTGNISSPTKTPVTQPLDTPPDNPLDDFNMSDGLNQPATVSMSQVDQINQPRTRPASHSGSQHGSQPGSPPGLSHSSPPSSGTLLDMDFGGGFSNFGHESDQKHATLGQGGDMDLFTDPSWNPSTYFNFDKGSSDSQMDFSSGFGDDPLFSDGV